MLRSKACWLQHGSALTMIRQRPGWAMARAVAGKSGHNLASPMKSNRGNLAARVAKA